LPSGSLIATFDERDVLEGASTNRTLHCMSTGDFLAAWIEFRPSSLTAHTRSPSNAPLIDGDGLQRLATHALHGVTP